MTQVNCFLEEYKLFNSDFIFQQRPMKETLQEKLRFINDYKNALEEARQQNPGFMADEEEKIKRQNEAEYELKASQFKITATENSLN